MLGAELPVAVLLSQYTVLATVTLRLEIASGCRSEITLLSYYNPIVKSGNLNVAHHSCRVK